MKYSFFYISKDDFDSIETEIVDGTGSYYRYSLTKTLSFTKSIYTLNSSLYETEFKNGVFIIFGSISADGTYVGPSITYSSALSELEDAPPGHYNWKLTLSFKMGSVSSSNINADSDLLFLVY